MSSTASSGLKTHAKILLVVRQDSDGIRRYCHVGTGNYNPKTATTYEDIGILSSDPELGSDLSELFNHLTGYSLEGDYGRLIVAPVHLRPTLQALIRGQAHPGGRIMLKMNSIVDARLIDELYAASAAGARIDLVVRGICCLRPGVPGLSEGITVRSIVGRYLEHSRICRFGVPGEADTVYVLGSADVMPRNLDKRVEAMLRVTEPNLRARLDEILELNLADDVLAWTLEPDSTWRKVPTVVGLDSHVRFQELAVAARLAPRHDRARRRGDRRRRDQGRARKFGRAALRARSRRCAAVKTPKTFTKRASRRGACARICARFATSSTPNGQTTCAPSCNGSAASSVRSATSK